MKTLFILCGIPGSGKSWFAHNRLAPAFDNCSYVSRDDIRFSLIEEDEDYFAHEKEVFRLFVCEIVHDLKNPNIDCVIADATHINWASRRKLIEALQKEIIFDNQLNIIPVYVRCSLEKALERNKLRKGREQVPEKVIRSMYGRFREPKDDLFDYDDILYVFNEEDR